jgi:hypothetical protein
MKQTSIDKISKVYVALQGSEYAKLAELLQDVIRAEAMTPAKAGKFNIYNYVADDEIRPAMNGVFLNDGWKTASDSHILISIKEEYDKEFEGRVMYKDGSFYNIHRRVKDENGEWVEKDQFTAYKDDEGHERTIYPKWQSVIPDEKKFGYQPYTFDKQKFYDWVDKLRTAWKTEHGKGIKWDGYWYCKIGPCVFKAELFSKLIEAMEYLGATEVLMAEERRAAMVRSDKGVCILMPVMQPDTFSESNPNHIVL